MPVETPPQGSGGVWRRSAAIATFIGSGANTLITAVLAVVLVPMYLRTAGAAQYGAWLACGDFLTWLQSFDLGMSNLLIQRVGSAYSAGDEEAMGTWFASGIVVLGAVSALAVTAGCIVSPLLPRLFHVEGPDGAALAGCFALASLAGGLALFTNVFVGFSRALQDTAFLNRVNVAGTLLGFFASFTALLAGSALWSIPIGLLSRAAFGLLGCLWYVFLRVPAHFRRHFGIRTGILREYLRAIPATGAGGIAYALMNQSETAIVAAMTRPELALVYNLSRKAVDMAGTLVDTVGIASYGGFAHLYGSAALREVRRVYIEIKTLRLAGAFALAGAYVLVNQGLMAKWVGAGVWGGGLLTFLFAIRFLVVGDAFLANYLFRASGRVELGSWLLAIEAILRVGLMVLGIHFFGVVAPPLATVLVCIPFMLLLERSLLQETGWPSRYRIRGEVGCLLAGGGAFLLACQLASHWFLPRGWIQVLASGGLAFAIGLVSLVALAPSLA